VCLPWCLPPTGTAQFPPQLPPPPVRRAESGWFNFLRRFPPPGSPPSDPAISQSASQITTLLDRASSLHATELSTFFTLPNATSGSAYNRAFLRNTLSPGTLGHPLVPSWFRAQIYTTPKRQRHWRTWQKGGESLCDKVEKSKRKVPKRDDRLRVARAILDQWGGDRAPNLCVSFTCSFYVHES
jgi:hypothetical protein